MNVSLVDKKVNDFTDIYLDLYPVVFCAVHSKVGNIDDAEDISQEVFIRFYRKYNEVETPRKWLFGALKLVVLEHYRKKKNEKIDEKDIFDDISLAYVNGFKDTRLIIEEALNDIDIFKDEKNRTLFELIAIHNFSYPKAGRQLGLSEMQVRYRYGQIVKSLIQYLNERGIKSLEDIL